MSELIPSIPLFTALLVGLAGAFGAGYFAYGAALYLTAGGAAWAVERGKRTMLAALLALAIALAVFGAAQLAIDPSPPELLPALPPLASLSR